MRKQTLVLLVLGGWGIGEEDNSNPIYKASPENMGHIRLNYPAGTLQASGIAVGLPWNEEGNPEVGYLTMGAGKVLYQDYPRISLAVKDGSFFENDKLLEAIVRAKEKNTKVNLVGMIGEGTSHSAMEHINALIKLMEQKSVPYSIHAFTDGKDSAPKSGADLLDRLPEGKVASVVGRYYAMDNDGHLDRTRRAYEAITGAVNPITGQKPADLLRSLYEKDQSDEFINPMLLNPEGAIKEGDSVILFNFSEDSQQQLVKMFLDPVYGGAPDLESGQTEVTKHEIPAGLHLVTFTDYGNQFNLPVAFPAEEVEKPLGKVISDAGRVQLRLAETEKYAYVTNLFNGMQEKAFPNEYRVLIPSREEAKVYEHPEMRVKDVSGRVVSAINEGIYDFILADFSNADVMAHTGNFDATVKAVQAIDQQVGAIMQSALGVGATLVITSTHGNAEVLMDLRTGAKETRNNISSVPIYVVANGWEREKSEAQAREIENLNTGVLSDIAPTVLELMGIPKPEEMTGISLINLLR